MNIRDGEKSYSRWYICSEGTKIDEVMANVKSYGYSKYIFPSINAAREWIKELEGGPQLKLSDPGNGDESLPYIECYE